MNYIFVICIIKFIVQDSSLVYLSYAKRIFEIESSVLFLAKLYYLVFFLEKFDICWDHRWLKAVLPFLVMIITTNKFISINLNGKSNYVHVVTTNIKKFNLQWNDSNIHSLNSKNNII